MLLALGAFVAGLIVGADSPERDAAQRYVSAWEREDYEAMYRMLTPAARSRVGAGEFADEYRRARRVATVRELGAGKASGPETVDGRDVVTVPMTVGTTAFGEVGGSVELPVVGKEIEWEPNMVFPGLAEGENLQRSTRAPERAAILADDGTALAEGQGIDRGSPLGAAALNVAGEVGVPEPEEERELVAAGFPEGTTAGTSGLEKAFNSRLAGTPGGVLEAVSEGGQKRPIAQTDPQDGEPVRTTIDPKLQQVAISALGDLFGGVAVLDAQRGRVLALAGIAYSAPQPPGSTFKVITTTTALDAGAVTLDEQFPVETSAVVGGREIANAHDEPCGGSFVASFANSCNSVFAPLGAEVGGEALVATAESYGFNSPPTMFNAEATAAVDAPESTIPNPIGPELDVAVSAIGQGKVQATPLQMASVAQTIAADGVRSPTPLVKGAELRADAKPVKVTSPEIARTIRDLMVEVVVSGTGSAAQLPAVQVAGKTGTAELGPKALEPGEEPPPAETTTPDGEPPEPEQELDAWFIAFAPAEKPKIAVAVMVVNAEGDGGEVAAPIAAQVLSAALES